MRSKICSALRTNPIVARTSRLSYCTETEIGESLLMPVSKEMFNPPRITLGMPETPDVIAFTPKSTPTRCLARTEKCTSVSSAKRTISCFSGGL